MTLQPPILVTGLPRSGTSLVTGILAICGAWTGRTSPPSPENLKGSFENELLRERLTKPYLTMRGYDPLGLTSPPPLEDGHLMSGEVWRRLVQDCLEADGYAGGPWVYKDAKLALYWRQWDLAFPQAKWVIVDRDRDEVIASCLRALPMVRRMGLSYSAWAAWYSLYSLRVKEVCLSSGFLWSASPGRILTDPEKFRDLKDLVDNTGLVWREREVRDFIDPRLWHGKLPK